jgi:hypothetical protein
MTLSRPILAATLVALGWCSITCAPSQSADANTEAPPEENFPPSPPIADAGSPDAPDGSASPSPGPLPGGRRFYTAAFGRFTTSCASNWVRLQFMTFNEDLTVAGAYWQWTESEPVTMAPAATANPLCTKTACKVWTTPGFLDQGGTAQQGTYSVQGNDLTISWTGGYVDRWRISLPSGDTARLTWLGSTSAATQGIGYGSNNSTNESKSLAEIQVALNGKSYPGLYQSVVGQKLIAGGSAVGFDGGLTPCQAANTSCIRARTPHSKNVCTEGCGAYGNPEKTITYYLASKNDSRKVAYENYCTCLAQGAECYDRGSHIKPMIQVLGDTGTFHGFVGVEASIRAPNCVGATLAVYGYTDIPGNSALSVP